MPQPLAPRPGTIGAALLDGERRLKRTDALSPRRHAELLLEYVLKTDRIDLYTRLAEELSLLQLNLYSSLLSRRIDGEPIQYIVGWAPFYGREFHIEPGVFIPRFDTELVIERLLADYSHCGKNDAHIIDLGCGSGVIGLTAALEIPLSRVTLIDNSIPALRLAEKNALKHGLQKTVEIIEWDALTAPPPKWRNRFDYVLSNPPYIPVAEIPSLHPDVQREPHAALSDSKDGLTFYRKWTKLLPELLKPGGRFIFEIGAGASVHNMKLYKSGFSELKITADLNGIPRVLEGKL